MIWYETRRFLIDLLCCTGIILMVVYLVIIAPYAILWTRWVAVSSFYSQSHMLDRCRSLKDKFVWTGLSSLKDKFVWTWLRSVGFLIINSFIIGAHTIFISYFFFGFTSIIFVPTLSVHLVFSDFDFEHLAHPSIYLYFYNNL